MFGWSARDLASGICWLPKEEWLFKVGLRFFYQFENVLWADLPVAMETGSTNTSSHLASAVPLLRACQQTVPGSLGRPLGGGHTHRAQPPCCALTDSAAAGMLLQAGSLLVVKAAHLPFISHLTSHSD